MHVDPIDWLRNVRPAPAGLPAELTRGGAAFQTQLQRVGAQQAAEERPAAPAIHSVARGENLTRIVKAHLKANGVDTDAKALYDAIQRVAKSNGLRNPDLILIGQKLDLSAALEKSPGTEDLTTLLNDTSPIPAMSASSIEAELPGGGVGGFSSPLRPDRLHFLRSLLHHVDKALPLNLSPGTSAPRSDTAVETAAAAAGPWSRLVEGPARLTSGFGYRRDPFTGRLGRHEGIDIAAKKGSSVYPVKEGEVVFSGWKRGYGRAVIVRHDDNTETLYGHTSKNLVRVGEKVSTDTVIANVGSTGRSTGPHLHFEVRNNGKAVNPIPTLSAPEPSLHVAQAVESL